MGRPDENKKGSFVPGKDGGRSRGSGRSDFVREEGEKRAEERSGEGQGKVREGSGRIAMRADADLRMHLPGTGRRPRGGAY